MNNTIVNIRYKGLAYLGVPIDDIDYARTGFMVRVRVGKKSPPIPAFVDECICIDDSIYITLTQNKNIPLNTHGHTEEYPFEPESPITGVAGYSMLINLMICDEIIKL